MVELCIRVCLRSCISNSPNSVSKHLQLVTHLVTETWVGKEDSNYLCDGGKTCTAAQRSLDRPRLTAGTWEQQNWESPLLLCTSTWVIGTPIRTRPTDRRAHLFMNRAHLFLSDQTMGVNGGQSGRVGAGRQLVSAADNQMDGPILQGSSILLLLLLTRCTTAVGHVLICSFWLHIHNKHENSSVRNSLMGVN